MTKRPTTPRLDDLAPAPYNPRDIDDTALEALKTSLHEFGDVAGITWNRRTGHIVTGHQRLRSLREQYGDELKMRRGVLHAPNGETFRVRVVDWPIEKEKAANVAANSPLLAGVFTEDLQALIAEIDTALPELGEDLLLGELLEALGFVQDLGDVEEDEPPEPPDEATTQPGDLWTLGDHRLLCGDSANPDCVDYLIDGAEVHLVNTDPPYNVRVEPRSGTAIAAGNSSFSGHHQKFDAARGKRSAAKKKMRAKDRPLENDFMSAEDFEKLLLAWFGNIARVLTPGGAFYIWGGYANCGNYPPALKASGLYFSQAVIWVKRHPVLTRKDFMGNHEWCFYGWREGAAHRFFGPANVPDVWEVKKVSPQQMVHLTEKPVELAARALEYSSKRGEGVLDLFAGSGSTVSAAEQTGRKALVMEIDPLYCDVVVERWQSLTGRKARRRKGVVS